jgi:FdhE protein
MTTEISALDGWLAVHPYLGEVAKLQQAIDAALNTDDSAPLPALQWDSLSGDFEKGIPFFRNRELDEAVIARAAELLGHLTQSLSAADTNEEMKRVSACLHDLFQSQPEFASTLVKQATMGVDLSLDPGSSIPPGAVRFLAWRALEKVLRPWVATLAGWMKESKWCQPYCPLCGSQPAMAQLVKTGKGRERFLSCGCCMSRWGYLRTSCPSCGNHDQDKLEIFELPQEENFRIDVCRECNGYIKTYLSEGDEDLLLADWSTLHLDVIAGQEGLQRRANSLYEL